MKMLFQQQEVLPQPTTQVVMPWIVVCPGLLLLLGNELFQVQYTHPHPFQLWH